MHWRRPYSPFQKIDPTFNCLRDETPHKGMRIDFLDTLGVPYGSAEKREDW
jgi:hypothetical protein